MPRASVAIRSEDDLTAAGGQANHKRGRDLDQRDQLHKKSLVLDQVNRCGGPEGGLTFTRYDHFLGLQRSCSLCSQSF